MGITPAVPSGPFWKPLSKTRTWRFSSIEQTACTVCTGCFSVIHFAPCEGLSITKNRHILADVPVSLFVGCFHCRGSTASAAAATAGTDSLLGICLLCPAGIGFRSLGGCLIGQTADPDQAVCLLGEPDPDQKFSVLRAGCQIHIPVTGLGKPAGTQHSAAADGAQILLTGHGAQGNALVRIVM